MKVMYKINNYVFGSRFKIASKQYNLEISDRVDSKHVIVVFDVKSETEKHRLDKMLTYVGKIL